MGWHASSLRYKDEADVNQNIHEYDQYDVPLEGVWLSRPYLDANISDFSINEERFQNFTEFSQNIQKFGRKLVLVLEAGLSADSDENKYLRMAISNEALLVDPFSKTPVRTCYGRKWANHTVAFLDFFQEKARDIWKEGLSDLYDKTKFDGIWLDMNEVTIDGNGCQPAIEEERPLTQQR